MTPELQTLIDQIPIRHDFASYVMLLGVVQCYFLAFVIFLRCKRNSALYFLGWTLLFQAIIFTDTWLCYTGLMGQTIFLNDSTEPFVLLVPAFFYLFALALIRNDQLSYKNIWPVLIVPVFYTLVQIPYYLAPTSVKLTAYLDAYHAHLCCLPSPEGFTYSYQWLKNRFDWLVLGSFLVYGLLGIRLVWKERGRILQLPNQANAKRYRIVRNALIILFAVLIFIFLIFYNYEDDGGDHYIGIALAMISFVTAYVLLAESRFFEKSWFADKYKTASGGIAFETIDAHIDQNEYFLQQAATLSKLAEQLESSSNAISKAINLKKGVNFNDYINAKRIAVAKERLLDPEYANLTVEAIGESVGFRSKSTFYAAFKKQMGQSPSAYIKASQG